MAHLDTWLSIVSIAVKGRVSTKPPTPSPKNNDFWLTMFLIQQYFVELEMPAELFSALAGLVAGYVLFGSQDEPCPRCEAGTWVNVKVLASQAPLQQAFLRHSPRCPRRR